MGQTPERTSGARTQRSKRPSTQGVPSGGRNAVENKRTNCAAKRSVAGLQVELQAHALRVQRQEGAREVHGLAPPPRAAA